MANTLLSIVEDAADEEGLPRPTSLISSTDTQARRLLAMANRTGEALAKEMDWAAMTRLHTFTTTAGEDEYALPTDYDHLIANTVWDRDLSMPLDGSISAQVWQSIKSGLVSTSLKSRYRILRTATSGAVGRKFVVDPGPEDSTDLAFEYVSNGWCANSAGDTVYDRWAADNDQFLLPRHLMVMGVIWRWRRGNTLEFTTELAEYNQALDIEKARDRPSFAIDLTGGGGQRSYNIPDTIEL